MYVIRKVQNFNESGCSLAENAGRSDKRSRGYSGPSKGLLDPGKIFSFISFYVVFYCLFVQIFLSSRYSYLFLKHANVLLDFLIRNFL